MWLSFEEADASSRSHTGITRLEQVSPHRGFMPVCRLLTTGKSVALLRAGCQAAVPIASPAGVFNPIVPPLSLQSAKPRAPAAIRARDAGTIWRAG